MDRLRLAPDAESVAHAPPPAAALLEVETLRFLLAAAASGAEDGAFALVDAAGVTPRSFTDPAAQAVFAALERLYTEGAGVSAARVLDFVPPAQRAAATRLVADAKTPAVAPDVFEQHLAALAHAGQRRELGAVLDAARQALRATTPTEQVEEDLRAALDTRTAGGRRVRSQAERWELLSGRLDAPVAPLNVDAAFRLSAPPLHGELSAAEHPAGAAWRAAGGATLATLLGGGLHAGELAALAGAAGVGKSTFALQLADAIAAQNAAPAAAGRTFTPVLYVGLEVDGYDLLEMSLARLAGVNLAALHSHAWRREAVSAAAVQAARDYYAANIAPYLRVFDGWFSGYGGVTLDAIRRQVRRLRADFVADTAAVFVDPLNRVLTGQRHVDRDERARTEAVAQGLHALAQREGVCVFALCDSTAPQELGAESRTLAPGAWFRAADILHHVASTTLYLDAGGEVRELFPELWKRDRYQKFMYAGDAQHAGEFTLGQRELARRLDACKQFPLVGPEYDYRQQYRSVYAALLCAKRRWEEPASLVFHYHKAIKRFEELPV